MSKHSSTAWQFIQSNCLRWLVAQAFRYTNIRDIWLSWCAFSSRQTTFEDSEWEREKESKYGHTGTHTSIHSTLRTEFHRNRIQKQSTYGERENVLGAPEYETNQQKQQLRAYLRLCWCEYGLCVQAFVCVYLNFVGTFMNFVFFRFNMAIAVFDVGCVWFIALRFSCN